MSRGSIARPLLAAVAVLGGAAAATATERRPLPAFEVRSLDGAPVASAALRRDGPWLLLHVGANCAPCGALSEGLTDAQQAAVVLILDGNDAHARAVAARFPALKGAQWLADPAHAVQRVLAIKAQPTIIGMRADIIEWRFSGMPRGANGTASIVSSWLKGR